MSPNQLDSFNSMKKSKSG